KGAACNFGEEPFHGTSELEVMYNGEAAVLTFGGLDNVLSFFDRHRKGLFDQDMFVECQSLFCQIVMRHRRGCHRDSVHFIDPSDFGQSCCLRMMPKPAP